MISNGLCNLGGWPEARARPSLKNPAWRVAPHRCLLRIIDIISLMRTLTRVFRPLTSQTVTRHHLSPGPFSPKLVSKPPPNRASRPHSRSSYRPAMSSAEEPVPPEEAAPAKSSSSTNADTPAPEPEPEPEPAPPPLTPGEFREYNRLAEQMDIFVRMPCLSFSLPPHLSQSSYSS